MACPVSDPELLKKLGCFVTLKKRGALRGCIGTFTAQDSLADNVIRMAVAAAFQDTRFPELERAELDGLEIEISVLGELRRIQSLDELVLGRDGIYVRAGARSGTFLPQVATEQKWTKEQFVMYCAREKAGLSPKEIAQAELFAYEVEKFSEKDFAKN